jgi:hypothetical protein
MSRIHQREQLSKYYKIYFKQYPNYQKYVLADGNKFLFILSSLPIVEHIKVKSEANPFDKRYRDYFNNRYLTLKKLTKF